MSHTTILEPLNLVEYVKNMNQGTGRSEEDFEEKVKTAKKKLQEKKINSYLSALDISNP